MLKTNIVAEVIKHILCIRTTRANTSRKCAPSVRRATDHGVWMWRLWLTQWKNRRITPSCWALVLVPSFSSWFWLLLWSITLSSRGIIFVVYHLFSYSYFSLTPCMPGLLEHRCFHCVLCSYIMQKKFILRFVIGHWTWVNCLVRCDHHSVVGN